MLIALLEIAALVTAGGYISKHVTVDVNFSDSSQEFARKLIAEGRARIPGAIAATQRLAIAGANLANQHLRQIYPPAIAPAVEVTTLAELEQTEFKLGEPKEVTPVTESELEILTAGKPVKKRIN